MSKAILTNEKIACMTKEELVAKVESLYNSTPDGHVIDADTILADMLEEADFHFNGISTDVFNIWKESFDKESVEKLFHEFTGAEFTDFLIKCINHTTR